MACWFVLNNVCCVCGVYSALYVFLKCFYYFIHRVVKLEKSLDQKKTYAGELKERHDELKEKSQHNVDKKVNGTFLSVLNKMQKIQDKNHA